MTGQKRTVARKQSANLLTSTGGHFTRALPEGFAAKRVQLILLAADPPGDPASPPNRLSTLRGSISGEAAASLDEHVRRVRKR